MTSDEGFEAIEPSVRYVKPKDCEGVEGTFVEMFADKFGNPAYKLTSSEGEVIVNSCGSMKNAMEQVQPGDYIKFKYLGVSKLESGKFKGSDFHRVQVLKKKVSES